MKQFIMIPIVFAALSCSSENKKKDNTLPEFKHVSILQDGKYTFRAYNDAIASVQINTNQEDPTITIQTTNTKFVLDLLENKEGETFYERNGIKARLTRDSLIIKQDTIIIELEKF